jgi:hypothetical protein
MWIFEVVPDGGNWNVIQLEGAGIVVSIHASKEMAIADGCRAASENEPSHLIIKTADRTIEKKVVYGTVPATWHVEAKDESIFVVAQLT